MLEKIKLIPQKTYLTLGTLNSCAVCFPKALKVYPRIGRPLKICLVSLSSAQALMPIWLKGFIFIVISTIHSIFGIGANISTVRDNNKNSIFSGIVVGSIIGAIILGIIILNIDNYITFINMDTKIYKTFAIYAIIQMFLQLLLNLSLCKLYYENNNKKANIIKKNRLNLDIPHKSG